MSNTAAESEDRQSLIGMPKASEVFCPKTIGGRHEIEHAFFRCLKLPNGTYKTTSSKRLEEFDQLIVEHATSSENGSVLDVGISSGVTTIDLERSLNACFEHVKIVALDQYLFGKLYCVGDGFEVLLTSKNEVLQVCICQINRPLPQSKYRWINRILRVGMGVAAMLAKRLAPEPRTVGLVVPEVNQRKSICLVEHDVAVYRKEWDSSFDLVRAANVLNRAYFSDVHLKAIAWNLVRYLQVGGLLAVCRTNDSTGSHAGSLFKRCDSEIAEVQEVATIGGGSEVRDIFLNVREP